MQKAHTKKNDSGTRDIRPTSAAFANDSSESQPILYRHDNRTLGGINVPVCPGSLMPSFDGYYETDGPYQGPVWALARGHAVQDRG
ncbi:hypothetical protein ASPCAL07092 [Aspergillus calidoustus]|uniref:Uncharacterized protein n=1 Tax=Aspergillus calidoustus TaxID=454130 RepID=A0A0U5CA23_ASPCI|nr:hypothetical protein ASPCAL07092 [Aspergillus calidoustus]